MPKIKYLILLFLLFLWSQASSQTATYTSDVTAIISGKLNEGFGFSISLSDNGKKLLVGAPYYNSNIGKAYLYEYIIETSTWSATTEFYGESHQEYFGFSVKLSGDGNTIAIGAPKTNVTVSGNTIVDVGSTNIYKISGSSWALSDIIYGAPNKIGTSQTERDISSHYNTSKDYSGYSVSLGYDGNRIVIGEPGFDKVISDEDNQGRARVFDYDNSSTWVLNKSLETSGLATSQTIKSDLLSNVLMIRAEDTNANTGAKVSVSGDNNTISVSSPNATTSFNGGAIDDLFIMQTSGNASHKDGLISVFKENIANNNWELKAEFLYTKGQTGIGTDLNPDGSIIIFGNPGTRRDYANNFTHTNAIGSGGEQIYNYDIASNQWTSEHNLQITITGSAPGGRNRRGNNVAISNNGSLIVTKLNTKFSIYEKINNVWTENQSIETESNQGNTREYYPGTQNLDISGNNNTIAYMYNFNANPNSSSNKIYIRKNTAINLNLSSTDSDNIITQNDEVTIAAVFSEDMASSPRISISGIVTNTIMTATSSTTWTYVWDVPAGSDGTVTATVSGTDISGNAYVGTDSITFTIDNTAPTVTLTDTDVDNVVKDSDNVTITATFNEDMATAPDISIVGLVTNVAMTATSSTTWTYVWDVPSGSDGTVTATVSGTDIAGNAYTGTDSITFTIDNTAPTITLTDTDSDNVVTNSDNVTITATFNENMATAPDISIGSLVTNVAMTATSSTTWTYVWNVPVGNDGTVRATVSGTDIVGNAYSGTDSITFNIDNTPAQIISSTINLDNTLINLQFNEAVYNTNNGSSALEVTDFVYSISGGTATLANTSPTSISTGVSNSYILGLSLSGAPDGTEILTIKPGSDTAIYDFLGNASLTANVSTTLTLNNQLPTITQTTVNSDNTVVTITFSEAMTAATVAANYTLSLSGGVGTLSNTTPSAVSQSSNVYSLTFSLSTPPNGSEILTVTANNSIIDANGEAIDYTKTQRNSIQLNDQIRPFITNISIDENNRFIDITCSEGLYGTNAASGPIIASVLEEILTQSAGASFNLNISGLTKTTGNPLIGGETTFRALLDLGGLNPLGNEAYSFIASNTTAIYDAGGNNIQIQNSNNTFTLSVPDSDGDGINNSIDNCPSVANASQADTDSDGIGDACDNAPNVANPSQTDTDGDGIGDAADTDDDADGVRDTEDAFPLDASENTDTDGDGTGDNADLDDDNDGVPDTSDNAPLTPNIDQLDTDSDGIGDIEDPDDDNDGYSDADEVSCGSDPLFAASLPADTDSDGIPNCLDPDDDNDGFSDTDETTCGSNPLDASSLPADADADRIPDCIDTDDDNDGFDDNNDAFSLDAAEWLDTDQDGIGNNADTDDDNDGQSDDHEMACGSDPLDGSEASADADADGLPDCVDTDDDNDGVEDTSDAFPLDPSEWTDTDVDSIGNNTDTDDDNDGYSDLDELSCDSDPLDRFNKPADQDGDLLGDCIDSDRDGDGVLNTQDVFPDNSREWQDTDGDGLGDNFEVDDDNDGVLDSMDAFPLDSSEWADSDLDGIGDNADTDIGNDGFPDEELVVSGVLTPNSSGSERFWKVINLEKYPINRVAVFDKNGVPVFSASNYQNNWSGTFKNSPLPGGSYYYIIKKGNGEMAEEGWLYITY